MLFTEGLTEPLRGWVKAYKPPTLQDSIRHTRDLADSVPKTKTFSKPFVPQRDQDRKPFQREWKGKEKMDDSGLKKKILTAVHDSPLAGHQGFFKTYRQIRERFSWKGLKQDVMRHVDECVTFQQNKSEHALPAGVLQPLPIPEQKWESISMDFIIGLPKV
jgi:hypothetical protein